MPSTFSIARKIAENEVKKIKVKISPQRTQRFRRGHREKR